MKHGIHRDPTFVRDRHGRAIALVPLAGGGGVACVLREDLEAIRAAGVTDQWHLSDGGYVSAALPHFDGWRAYHDPGGVIVARLVARAQPGWIVSYRDDDKLNLCRDNLRLRRRRAGAGRLHFVLPEGPT
jgi:hypothetical protein